MYQINKIKKNRFTYKDLMEWYNIDSYDELYKLAKYLMDQNIVCPIKSKGMTSFMPKSYAEYKKTMEKKDYSQLNTEITKLNTSLNISKYLNNPEAFEELKDYINKLSDYLWKNKNKLQNEISVKERSFEIWGDEKFLESKEGKKICAFNSIGEKSLNFYYAPEPFFCVDTNKKSKDLVALVIENKDTWYSIGRSLKNSENKMFYGTEINLLIYGEGNKVTRKNAVTDFLSIFSDHILKVYYAGDIDRAGINMIYDCNKNNQIEIEPFIPLYKQMINSAHVNKIKQTGDNRGMGYDRDFLNYFNTNEQKIIEEVLDGNKRIPQEILNYQDYLKNTY